MANKTIPQLNQVSAATDLDYLVITNSGETTTSKITRQDLLAGTDIAGGLVNGTGADSLKSADNLTTTAASAPQQYDIAIGNNARTSSGAGGIAIGKNAVAGGVIRKALAIGQDTSATGTGVAVGFDTDANGDGAVAVGLYNNASQESSLALGVLATSTGRWGAAIGRDVSSTGQRQVSIGQGNTITNGSATGGNGEGNAILAGYSNSISSTGQINTIIGGRSNSITGTTSGTTIIGLENFKATANNTTYVDNLQVLGTSNLSPGLINGTGADSLKSADNLTPTYGPAISSGIGSIALGTQAEATEFAASAIGWNTEATGSVSVAIGASARALGDNTISIGNTSRSNNQGSISIGEQAQSRANNAVVIGQLRDSTGANSVNIGVGNFTINGDYSVLLGGQAANINTTGDHNMILGGNNIKITGATNHTTLINLTGFSSPVQSNTTYVENIHYLRTPIASVQAETTGTTFTINWDSGNKAQAYLTGVSTIDFTNVKDGGSFLLKTTTDGGHSITWSASGFTFLWAGGDDTPGNNQTDMWRFEVFGTIIYGEKIGNFS